MGHDIQYNSFPQEPILVAIANMAPKVEEDKFLFLGETGQGSLYLSLWKDTDFILPYFYFSFLPYEIFDKWHCMLRAVNRFILVAQMLRGGLFCM